MPRKYRPGKDRKEGQFPWHRLRLREKIELSAGWQPPLAGSIPRLTNTIEDARAAYFENRDRFTVCLHDEYLTNCRHEHGSDDVSPAGHRVWGWWVFEKGYDDVPEDEPAELERLGLLSARERHAMTMQDKL